MIDRLKATPLTRLVAMLAAGALALGACGGDDAGGGTGEPAEPTDGGDDTAGAAWTDADLERLVATEIVGYTLEDPNFSVFGNATVKYVEDTPSGPVPLSALVTFQACDPFVCTDLSAEIDEQRRENARSLLPSIHIENPDLVEEIGPTELAGRPVLVIYFRSFVEHDTGRATANSYRAFTHDGANLITVMVGPDFESGGGLADSAEDLEARMDADAGAAVAADILSGLSAELG